MTILLVHNFYKYPGGEETYFFSLKKLLEDNGHRIITYTKNNKQIDRSMLSKIQIAINLFRNSQTEKEISKILSIHKPDIVHCNNIYLLITPSIYRVCKKFNVPVIQTVHNYRMICPGGLMYKNGKPCVHSKKGKSIKKLFNNCYRESYIQSFIFSLAFIFNRIIGIYDLIDLYLFPSNFTLNIYKQYLKIPNKKLIYLPNFVDIKKGAKKEGDYFLFVGRLSQEKGIVNLLDVFSHLPNINLIVIGDGPLKNRVNKFKKFENITVLPFLPKSNIYKYMQMAMYTIIPSRWYEVLPMTMIESFANGTPVIAPKIGEFTKIISNSNTGLLFKFNDKISLQKIIIKAHKDRENAKKMGISARNIYEKNFTSQEHYQKLLSIYSSRTLYK